MNISVVIATLNRSKDLKVLFESLVIQIKMPLEIIIRQVSGSSLPQTDNGFKTNNIAQHRTQYPGQSTCGQGLRPQGHQTEIRQETVSRKIKIFAVADDTDFIST